MNEFELVGPQFLWFYSAVMGATTFGAFIVRALLKNVDGEFPEVEITAYDAAYLSGGNQRVVDAGVAKLLLANVLTTTSIPPSIEATGNLSANAHIVEQTIFQSVKLHATRCARDIYRYMLPVSESLRPKLIQAGLIVNDSRTALIRTACTLLTLSPVLFWGIPKMLLGFSKHRPIAFLTLLCALGLLTAFWFFRQQCIRTSRGDEAVAYLKDENKSLEYSLSHGSPATGSE